jgi:ubiquinone biosynthesis protein
VSAPRTGGHEGAERDQGDAVGGEDGPAEAAAPDTAIGVFTEAGPWNVDPEALTWRRGLAGVRARLSASLPRLTARRTLPPGRRLGTTVWHLGGALGLWYVRERRLGGSASVAGLSRRLRVAAETLGPTYIKLGQIVASGDGIFPAELVAEFKWCRDQVPAEPWTAVARLLTEELGAPISSVFASVDETPLAAASIAQVHAATLLDGTPVVVKVQRPAVSRRVYEDLAVMAWLAPHLVGRIPVAALANPPALVELFAETITEELDFRLEAENMLDIAMTFAALDQRDFVVPRPHPTLVTRRMLVMERLDGFNFGDVEGMRAAGIDTEAVVRAGMIGFLEGAMLYGIFHGDLHGGNLFVLPSGRTALLDFGITGRLTEPKRLALLSLLVGASNGHLPTQVAALRDLGAFPDDVDVAHVIDLLGLDRPPVDPTTLTPDELVAEMQRSIKTLLGIGARLPKELMLFVKNMMFLDGAIATLAPDLDLFAEVEAIALLFAAKHGERIMSQLGLEHQVDWAPDMSGFRAGFGLDETTESLTYRDIQARRAQVREKFEERGRRRSGRSLRRRRAPS